jgi:hypothetical protein
MAPGLRRAAADAITMDDARAAAATRGGTIAVPAAGTSQNRLTVG